MRTIPLGSGGHLSLLTHQPVEVGAGQRVEGLVGRSEEGQCPLLVEQLRHPGGLHGPHQDTETRRGPWRHFL